MLEPGSIPTKGQRLVPNMAVSTKHWRGRRAELQGERAGLAPELAAECVSTFWMAAGFAVGAGCVWHRCGAVLTGSLCLEFSGLRIENELERLEAKPPRGGAESNLSVLSSVCTHDKQRQRPDLTEGVLQLSHSDRVTQTPLFWGS